ncbi:PASTA domain-containing protein [Mycolicibacterium moriokaense]|nr:PASTA domain-containing protein [Mycolicibacterium moriokaense]
MTRMQKSMVVALVAVGMAGCSSEPPPDDVRVPKLVGLYWTQAEPQLRALGWEGAVVKGPDVPASPNDRNRIMAQDPSAGAYIAPGSAITLQFGH